MLNRLKDVFKSLQEHEVKYLVIGGIASILYGIPRATFDLDILIETTEQNAKRLLEALKAVGFGTASMTDADALLANAITIFKDRVRIDVQTSTPGILFEAAWELRNTVNYEGQTIFLISRDDLIASKLASGRSVDLEDVRMLELDK